MEAYEVKFQVTPAAGNSVWRTDTVTTHSAEGAKTMVYRMLRNERALCTRVKFMYVRRVPSGTE